MKPPFSTAGVPRRGRRGWMAATAALFAAHLALGIGFILHSSATCDEPLHLVSGYSYWKTGRYWLNIFDHPPAANMWSAFPLLWLNPTLDLNHPVWRLGSPYSYEDYFRYHNVFLTKERVPILPPYFIADLFLYQNSISADTLLNAARIFSFVTLSFILLAGLVLWARREAGTAGAAVAAICYAFCPAILSNLPIVGTDGASTVFFFSAFGAIAYGRSRLCYAAAGLFAALAMASKFNMMILPPLLLGTVFVETFFERKQRLRDFVFKSLIFLGITAAGILMIYRFDQVSLYWKGFLSTFHRVQAGRPSFFFGAYSQTGVWYYFPVVLAIKTPLALLILAGFGLKECLIPFTPRRLGAWLPAVVYLAASMASKTQIGYRHILPAIPFVILLAGFGGARLWEGRAGGRRLLIFLAVWLSVSSLAVHPHYLAYFNELVGGPSFGDRCLSDSNLDWGQDLKGLSEKVKEMGNPPIYLSYFGAADPSAYPLRYVPVSFVGSVKRAGDFIDPALSSGRVLLGISVTNLQGTYLPHKNEFQWLRNITPLAKIGYSIYLYDLTEDPASRQMLCRRLPAKLRESVCATSPAEGRNPGALSPAHTNLQGP